MSWITNIAGKAEELLNKIDQNAAEVLKKGDSNSSSKNSNKKKVGSQDCSIEESLDNTSESERLTSPCKSMKSSQSSPTISLSHSYHQYPDLLDSTLSHEDPNSLNNDEKLLLLDKSNLTEDVREVVNENIMLKNEIRTLNSEISLLLTRVKQSNKDTSCFEEKLTKSEAESVVLNQELNDISSKLSKAEYQCHLLKAENERFKSLANDNENSKVLKLQQELSELQFKYQREEEVHLNNIACLERRLGICESQLAESESERKKCLEELRLELEQYRTKVHQQQTELDRYRNNSVDNSLSNNSNELLMECSRLREELEEAKHDSKLLNEKLEISKKEASSLQIELTTYRDRAISAEHNHNTLKKELDGVRRDMMDKVSRLTDDVKSRENELRQAKTELVARRSQDTWQSRVANLTSALVRKQAALEQASTESAQLRLQLEKAKNKCREYSQQMQTSRNGNDTDDVKAQVPVFFAHNPFDRSFTRRIKQFYSVMDSAANRVTAILLRRYPFARIVVLLYLIILHSIICLILYSWTPDTK